MSSRRGKFQESELVEAFKWKTIFHELDQLGLNHFIEDKVKNINQQLGGALTYTLEKCTEDFIEKILDQTEKTQLINAIKDKVAERKQFSDKKYYVIVHIIAGADPMKRTILYVRIAEESHLFNVIGEAIADIFA